MNQEGSTLYQIQGDKLVKYDDIPKVEVQFETEEERDIFGEFLQTEEFRKEFRIFKSKGKPLTK